MWGGGGGNTYIGTWEIAGRKIGLERVGVGEVRNQGEWALGKSGIRESGRWGSQESGRVGVGNSGIWESGRWGSQESGRVGVGGVRNLGDVGIRGVGNLGEWALGKSGIWETWGKWGIRKSGGVGQLDSGRVDGRERGDPDDQRRTDYCWHILHNFNLLYSSFQTTRSGKSQKHGECERIFADLLSRFGGGFGKECLMVSEDDKQLEGGRCGPG